MDVHPPPLRGFWSDDEVTRSVYAEAAGIHRIVPIAVAVPADADDVVTLVQWAAAHHVPLTPRGSGSSMAGAAVGPGVIVDLSRLRVIGSIDTARALVKTGPGAICSDVDAAARRHGLRFPVDPSSEHFCTVGGMAATNAAGGRTLRYGPMNAWVAGIDCVFADGTRAWVRRGSRSPECPAVERFGKIARTLRDAERGAPTRHPGVRKDTSGYGLHAWLHSDSLVDLLVGSEGTLALFVGLELRLAPLPAVTASMLASFTTIDAAAAAAGAAAELNASACELLERTFLDIARGGGALPVPDDTEAVLLVELEEPTRDRLEEMASALSAAFKQAGASRVETALDAAHAARLWRLRHAASPMLAALGGATISMQVIEDGAVPPGKLPDYVRGVRAALDKQGFRGVLFGHAGDAHVHTNVLVDTSETGWRERLHALFASVAELTAKLGGTMAGEHGDGRLRAEQLGRMWPQAAIERFRSVKAAFDPDGILNPGVKLAASDAPPFGAPLKYDPSLPPLPAAARAALDRVQRERAWNRFRMELLAEASRQ